MLQPLNDNYLPAEGAGGSVHVHRTPQHRAFLPWTRRPNRPCCLHRPPAPPQRACCALQTADDVLALAEQWLQQSCPPWLMGWRDITNATNERTVIASVLPLAGWGTSHSVVFARSSEKAAFGQPGALVLISWRGKIGGARLNSSTCQQFPVLPRPLHQNRPGLYRPARARTHLHRARPGKAGRDLGHNGPRSLRPRAPRPTARRARRLLRPPLRPDPRRAALHPRPAAVLGDDYPSETFRVLKVQTQMREFGEYRTQRLVLAAWDARTEQ